MARPKKLVLASSDLEALTAERERLKAKFDSHNEAGKVMASNLRELDRRIEEAEARNRHQIMDGVLQKFDPAERDGILASLQSMDAATLLAALGKSSASQTAPAKAADLTPAS